MQTNAYNAYKHKFATKLKQTDDRPTYIYVLELKYGKYYVGKTKDPQMRLEAHDDHRGSAWTKKYAPVKLVEMVQGDDLAENTFTFKYMIEYGIPNVRGGSFVQITLPNEVISTLELIINGTTDKCFRCGSAGHWAASCKKPKYVTKSINTPIGIINANDASNTNNTLSTADTEIALDNIPVVTLPPTYRDNSTHSTPNNHIDTEAAMRMVHQLNARLADQPPAVRYCIISIVMTVVAIVCIMGIYWGV